MRSLVPRSFHVGGAEAVHKNIESTQVAVNQKAHVNSEKVRELPLPDTAGPKPPRWSRKPQKRPTLPHRSPVLRPPRASLQYTLRLLTKRAGQIVESERLTAAVHPGSRFRSSSHLHRSLRWSEISPILAISVETWQRAVNRKSNRTRSGSCLPP